MQNTTKIKVLGTGTSKHQMVTSVLKEFLTRAGLFYPVEDYSDIDSFLNHGVDLVPAVIFKDQIYNIGSNGGFNQGLRTAVGAVLKESNFGQIEKIVIPVDFSDVSNNAFAYGHRLATDLGAITKALHVYFPDAKRVLESSNVDVDFVKLRESYLEDFIATFDHDWGSDLMRVSLIDSEFRIGFPGNEILDSIEDNAACITVMGSTGKSGLLKKWFGSVSTKVMNDSPAPVLIVPRGANYHGVNRIAYAFENIEQDKTVLEDLADFANRFGAEIHLIHVDNVGVTNPGYYITEVMSKYYPSALITTSTIETDNIVKGITDYCGAHSIDIISLSSHKKGFFEQLYDDNISREVSVTTDIPLLVLKS